MASKRRRSKGRTVEVVVSAERLQSCQTSLVARGLYLSLQTVMQLSQVETVTGTVSEIARKIGSEEAAVRFGLKSLAGLLEVTTDGENVTLRCPILAKKSAVREARILAGKKSAEKRFLFSDGQQNGQQNVEQNVFPNSWISTGTSANALNKTVNKTGNKTFAPTSAPENVAFPAGEEKGKTIDPPSVSHRFQLSPTTGELLKEAGPAVWGTIAGEWNTLPGMKRCGRIGDLRAAKIRRQMRDLFFAANWRDAMEKLREDGITGKSIDWFLSENRVQEIMDGVPQGSDGFVAPSVEDVREYCAARGNKINAESFVSFYEARGWLIGKTKMKDWKAAVRTWELRQRDEVGKAPEFKSKQQLLEENNTRVFAKVFGSKSNNVVYAK